MKERPSDYTSFKVREPIIMTYTWYDVSPPKAEALIGGIFYLCSWNLHRSI